jgi:hypothetical protein
MMPHRDSVFRSFAACLRPKGLLIVDVREEDRSRQRADRTPHHRTVEIQPGTCLDFTSTVAWNAGLLHVHEQYVLRTEQQAPQESTYDFVMRPWTEEELHQRLATAGFRDIQTGPGIGRKTSDRLLVTAVR